MKIAIIGFGLEGQAAYAYYHDGNELTICDRNTSMSVPEGTIAKLGEDYLQGLDDYELIIRSPNVHPRDIVAANSPEIASKVTSNLNIFLEVCPTTNIIGITGTKGKGTTSTMVTQILRAAGKTVHLGGNIGIAPLTLLAGSIQPSDWVVLELSSFQLSDVKHSPKLAACLMVEAEHLDWHKDVQEYLHAKQQLFRWQTPDDIAVFYPKSNYSQQIVSISPGVKLPYLQAPGAEVLAGTISIAGQTICKTSDLKLLGEHNLQNVCAAVTIVWQVTQDITAISSVLTSFSGLPFRIEYRTEVDGIRYYNDSFASGPAATLAAIRAIPEKKVMILGGYDRGLDLQAFGAALQTLHPQLRSLLLVGASAERLARVLQAHGVTNYTLSDATTMPEIVTQATQLAEPGDAVVLSPAFASFDMFKNFEDRGKQFNAAVSAL